MSELLAGADISGLPQRGKVVVGFSGGADSTALAHWLLGRLGPERLVLAHVNHQLRGEESDRDEAAARAFAQACVRGESRPEDLTEEAFGSYLFSAGVPDPDLVIRPSGEIRISNFLLWQSAYAEFYFTDVLWPDFTKEELHKALAAYQGRSRRFGGV